ncbi:MAG TPA: C25 family cysteine peptidase, partial [bacterium]
RLCRSVIIPDNALTQARVVSSQYRDIPNVRIAPSKGHLLRTVNPDDVPFEFGSVYQRDAWYPENVAELRDPYILRDLRGQVVEVNAFQYNPVRRILRVYTNLTVEIAAVGVGGANVLDRSAPLSKMDPNFRAIYQRHFVNYFDDRYTPVEEIGPMLVITYDGFNSIAQDLVDWKNQKGIPTTMVNVSTIGNNPTAIKNYIRSIYETTGLTFVLLVGDHAQVQSPISGGGTDPTYGMLAGTDHYPELFVGRFSAETQQQALTQVVRTLEYETMPQAGATWYSKGLGVASNQGVGVGHYGEGDWQHINLIRGDLIRYGYTQVDSVYDPWGTQAMISNYLNDGRSTVNYCGHGSTTSWGTTGFSNTQVNALVNDNMLPFMTSVACVVGNFTSSTCFCEAWLRAQHNGEPTGAIAHWGSSQNQSWAPPMYAQDEFIDLLCDDRFHSYGALCMNGAMLMIDETGSTGNSETDHWIIFGDPSLQLRTTAPTTLAVAHNNQINYGQPTFDVTVTGVSGALAALSDGGTLLGYAYTNASGLATINITGQLPQGGYVTVTVTSYNATPYSAQIPVITSGPDLWPPLIVHTPLTNTTSPGPYVVDATITDYSGVASATIFYNVNGGAFAQVAMTNPSANDWTGNIPGQPAGSDISYYIRAVDASPQSNAGNSPTYNFLVLAMIFSDNIEGGVGNWTHAPISAGWADQWHISTEISHSVSHAWKCGDPSTGNYANHADGGLLSQTITLGSDCELTFWSWIAAEASGTYPDSAYDGGVVEISHNGGPWAVLDMPGYTHHIRSTAGGGNPYTGPFVPGTPVFSGTGATWVQQTADLSAYVGDIQLRFRFGSDNSGNNEGWYVDDLQIIGLPGGSFPNIAVTLMPYGTPIIIPANGGSFNYNIAITNNEATIQSFTVWCMITLPSGSPYGPVLGPVNLNLPAGASINRDRSQNIARSSPPGNYVFNAYVGVYPGVVWDSDSFPFTKSTTGDGPWVDNWNNFGEPFESEIGGTSAVVSPVDAFSFRGAYPNPFNPITRFSFSLPEAAQVTLQVFDLQGRLVATLAEGMRDAGSHEATFDASHLASGIYLYHLTAGSFDAGGKMVLLK